MKRATIRTTHPDASTIAAAVRPDNTEEMNTTLDDGELATRIERETTGGLHTTVDDYLVNVIVAEAVLGRLESETMTTDEPREPNNE